MWNRGYGKDFGLRVTPVAYYEFDRDPKSSNYAGIESQLLSVQLAPGVDRLIWFVGHTPGEYAAGAVCSMLALPLPLGGDSLITMFGYTDDSTQTHSFVFAYGDASASLIFTPSRVTVHEMFHQMGCGHYDMDECYRRIAFLKRAANDHPGDMFPAVFYPDNWQANEPYRVLYYRAQVNDAVQGELVGTTGCH